MRGSKLSKEEKQRQIASVVALCQLSGLLERHPYDLSGGEQQRAALAKVLLLEPQILLLDEPTKGLDAEFKQILARILLILNQRGIAVLMVSHDVEFCAEYAGRCAMMFDGLIVADSTPQEFFCGNSFYTTAAHRMARQLLPEAVTASDVIAACGGLPPALPDLPQEDIPLSAAPALKSRAGRRQKPHCHYGGKSWLESLARRCWQAWSMP